MIKMCVGFSYFIPLSSSLRAQFVVEDVPINQLHGSDSDSQAQKEIEYFFPMQQTVACIKPDAYQTKGETWMIWMEKSAQVKSLH